MQKHVHRSPSPGAALWLCLLCGPLLSDCTPEATEHSHGHASLHEARLAIDADSYLDSIDSYAEDTNFGSEDQIYVDQWAVGLVRVDPAAIRAQAGVRRLVRAYLRFHVNVRTGSPFTVATYSMDVGWNEESVTWNCPSDGNLNNLAPDCTGTEWEIDASDPWHRPFAQQPSDSTTFTAAAPVSGEQLELDVTADVLRILDGHGGLGWLIRKENGEFGTLYIASRHHWDSDRHPELVLEMEEMTFVPTGCSTPPDLDDSRVTRVADVVEHLWDAGSCQVQLGTSDAVLRPEQVSHLRGKVIDAAGNALSGVHVRILGHSDFGWTASRGDGWWDLVVNGGGPLVVEFTKGEHLTVQRWVEVIRNDYVVLDDVVMLEQQDGTECLQVSGATGGFYLGPEETDGRGPRRLAMYFPSSSTMTITDVGSSTVTDYCVCSVEHTVDRTSSATGPRAMPGALPATSAYTYAVDLQLRPFDTMAGECDAAPVAGPTFSTPIFAYVLDHDASATTTFLGFDVGTSVPAGHYDQQAAAWIAEPDGRVVDIVDDGSGGCAFDVHGDANPDTDIDGYPAHDVTTAELLALASQCGSGQPFDIGDRIWRIPVYHFSDWNWALGFLGGALLPFLEWMGDGMTNDACHTGGSVIGCEDQTLGEIVPIAGTPWALHYQSERQRGRSSRYQLDIPFRGRVLESGTACSDDGDCSAGEVCGADGQCATEPVEVQVEVQIAGNRWVYDDLDYGEGSFHFGAWDGHDAWGRLLQGAVPVTVRLGYFFDAAYVDPESVAGRSFSMPPDGTVTPDVPAGRVGFWTTWRGLIGGWDQGSDDGRARGQGLGGWSITPHHVYDARAGILYRGDGTQLSTRGIQPEIHTIAGGGSGGEGDPAAGASLPYPVAAAMAPDGTVYVVHAGIGTGTNRVRQITPEGILRPFAGDGTYDDADDDVAAAEAAFRFGQADPRSGIIVRRNGAVVVVDRRNNTVREIVGGRVHRIAGQQRYNAIEGCDADMAPLGDGGPAEDALLRCPNDVVEGPDGALYITEEGNDRIRRVDAAGRITTFAMITNPGGIAISERGDVYVVGNGNSIWRVNPGSSTHRLVAGGGGGLGCTGSQSTGDGGPGWLACLAGARDLAIARDGSVYVVETTTEKIRRVAPNGIIETVAGQGETICETCTPRRMRGDGGAATSAYFFTPAAVFIGHDGAVYIVDSGDQRVRRVRAALPDAVVGESVIAELDGSLIYRFDDWGRHIATQHGLTGEDLLAIEYENATSGFVTRLTTYGGGPDVEIDRDSLTHLPTRLESGFGQETSFVYDVTGYTAEIEDPEGRAHVMSYDGPGMGLLDSFTTPDGETWTFTYADGGRLASDTATSSISQILLRRECGSDYMCDSDVSAGFGVVHSLHLAAWQTRDFDVWRIGDARLRRRVTERTGARTVWELGDLDGVLSAATVGSTESVAITQLIESADGTVVSLATGADPRPGVGDYIRAIRVERPSTMTTEVTILREIVPSDAATVADITDLNHRIEVNGSRTTTIDVHLDDTTPTCWIASTVTGPAPNNYVTTICADGLGRVRSIDAPGFEQLQIAYDATTGDVSTITQGARQTQISYAAPGGGSQPWPRWVASMDGMTERERTTFTRDAAGWIGQVDHSSSAMTSSTLGIGRDLRGRMTSLTLPHGHTHQQSHWPFGPPRRYTPPTVTSTSPGGILDVPRHNRAGNPVALRVMNATTTVATATYRYHSVHGYLDRISLPGSRSLEITRDTTTNPDMTPASGRVSALSIDGTTTEYTYDGPFLDAETWSGTVAGTVDRDIDAYGELSEITINSTALTYDHDADGRLIQAHDLTIVPSLETSPSEHWERATSLGSGSSEITSAEVLNRYGELDVLTVEHATAGTLYEYEVTTRDAVGRETARDEQLTGESARAYTFFYDGENRLEEVRIGGSAVATYGYDANGNRTSVTYAGAWNALPDVAHTTYDQQDRLVQYGNGSMGDGIQCTYTYTAAGYLATRNCGSGTETFDYDLLGNLLSAEELASGNDVLYDVDALGRRIRRRVMDGMTVLEEQRWLYLDGLNPVVELDDSNAIVRIFVYGTRANVPDYMIQGSSKYRFITDPRGSLRAVVDSSGTVVQRMEYDAFGNIVSQYLASGFDRVPFGFAGGIYDPETNLVRFGARDYDPVTGRWTAKDPLLFRSGDTSLYRYSQGDPINFVDTDGRVVLGVAAVLVLGGALINGAINGVTNGSQVYAGGGRFADGFAAGFIAGFAGGLVGGLVGLWSPVAGGAFGGAITSGLTVILTAVICGGGDVSWDDVALAAGLGGLGGSIFGAAGRAAFNARLPTAAAEAGGALADGFGTVLGETTGSSLSGLTLTLINPGTNFPQPPRGVRGLPR